VAQLKKIWKNKKSVPKKSRTNKKKREERRNTS